MLVIIGGVFGFHDVEYNVVGCKNGVFQRTYLFHKKQNICLYSKIKWRNKKNGTYSNLDMDRKNSTKIIR
jgi:hypothetical protein